MRQKQHKTQESTFCLQMLKMNVFGRPRVKRTSLSLGLSDIGNVANVANVGDISPCNVAVAHDCSVLLVHDCSRRELGVDSKPTPVPTER